MEILCFKPKFCTCTRVKRQFTGLEIATRPKFTFHTPKSPQRCPLHVSGFNSIVSWHLMEIRRFKPKCTHSLYIYTRVERQFTGLEIAIRPKFTSHTPKSPQWCPLHASGFNSIVSWHLMEIRSFKPKCTHSLYIYTCGTAIHGAWDSYTF